MNEIKFLLKDLFSYCYVHPDTIPLLEENEIGGLLSRYPKAKSVYENLKDFNEVIKKGKDIDVAKSISFTKEELASFEDSSRIRNLVFKELIHKVISFLQFEIPMRDLIRADALRESVITLLRSGDISYTEGLRKYIGAGADTKAKAAQDFFTPNLSQKSKEIMQEYREELQKTPLTAVIETGTKGVDLMLDAIKRSTFGVIGARTNGGKTAFAIYLSYYASKTQNVTYISLEMSPASLCKRSIALELGIPINAIDSVLRFGSVPKIDCVDKLTGGIFEDTIQSDSIHRIHSLKHFENMSYRHLTGARTVDAICLAIQQEIDKGSTFIVVDYLQNVANRGGEDNPTMAVTQLCINLQSIATTNNITIVACSQLNRAGIGEFIPSMYHFKGSSAIETSADFIYTLCEVPQPPPESAGIRFCLNNSYDSINLKHLLLSLVKNRHGDNSRQLELGFLGEYNSFFQVGSHEYDALQNLFKKEFDSYMI